MWSPTTLAPQLPLRFPVDPALPASPKLRYRSAYQPPQPGACPDPAQWGDRTDFELALALIDFSGLERALATAYVSSAKGQVPFHPVSLFLCLCLRREQQLSWRALARLLRHDRHGAGWRAHFGFADGVTPSASGLRHFQNAVGAACCADLCPQFIRLLRQHGLAPEQSTYPGDPPTRGVTISQDGMLHFARHRSCCHLATTSCFQSLTDLRAAALAADPGSSDPSAPVATAPASDPGSSDSAAPLATTLPLLSRPCRAREHRLPGCDCAATPTCAEHCDQASQLDPAARLIHYAGRAPRGITPAGDKARTPRGIDVFGYRSLTERLLDDRFAVSWTATSNLYPANTDERTVLRARVQALVRAFPDLRLGEWLDDAGVGFGDCLDAIWELGALRMVAPREDPSDRDPAACLARGYNAQGRPLCAHGYALRANGYDHTRRRATYVCAQACVREALRDGDPVTPVAGCPYRDATTVGFSVHVGRTLPDGSVRLAREIPLGSEVWQARYGRRNLSESRNGLIEGLRLKRLPSYGDDRNTKEVQVADFLINLRTLGRLVRQAATLPPG
jgi:hypothetical protein